MSRSLSRPGKLNVTERKGKGATSDLTGESNRKQALTFLRLSESGDSLLPRLRSLFKAGTGGVTPLCNTEDRHTSSVDMVNTAGSNGKPVDKVQT